MNRGDNGNSTESASGGLYREDARGICGNKLDLKYLCGDERPSGHKTRQGGSHSEMTKEEEAETTGGEVVQHLSNRRNRNRIRRQLTREIYNMERREDILAERREIKICCLREQLKAYQRIPRMDHGLTCLKGKHKCRLKEAKGRCKSRKGASTRRPQQQ